MSIAYRNCTLLDGSADMSPRPGMTVVVEKDRIAAVLPDAEAPADAETVDLGGAYLLPGLINLHIHLPGSGKPKKKQTDTKKIVRLIHKIPFGIRILDSMCAGFAKMELMSGVTTVRTVGGVDDSDARCRDRIRRGEIPGPRMLVANEAISVPGGHMAGSLAFEALSAEHAAQLVDRIAEGKPDLIKLMITGGVLDATEVGEPGVLRMPPEYVKAACGRAHELGFTVAAHVESPEGVRVALENGVDTIEHGAKPDEEILRLFKERDARLVATLSPALPYAEFDRGVSNCSEMDQTNGKIVFHGIIDCARAALEAGIPVGLGTDTGCPFVTHYDMWREVNYFVKYCGVSPAFALHTATMVNASIAGVEKETGSIEPGKSADFIVCASDPLEDLSALRKLELVVCRGRAYNHPRIRKYKKAEVELDKFI